MPGEPMREMLIEAVPADHRLEFLTDNGGAYLAADTRAMACSLGLVPVNTFKRDYVARMDLRDATKVMAQLPAAQEFIGAQVT